MSVPSPSPAPTGFSGLVRHLGPGLIISAGIVGSGELIVTPKVGAENGFALLWFILLGCVIKVFVQVELGRYTVTRGATTLETMDRLPGPRWRVSWLLWLWLLMFLAAVFQKAGMVTGIATIFELAGMQTSQNTLIIAIGAVTALLLVVGRYRLVQTLSTAMVVAFTFCTLVAVGALQFTPYAVTPANIIDGFRFDLPPSFTAAFAAFGIIGVGATELIYYPYWCLEKGYARNVGPPENTSAWRERARGWMRVMRFDAWVSCVIYTGATLAFFLLGAAVLHAKGLVVGDSEMIPTLSHMYRETFGEWSHPLFLVGAFAVLYSTVFVATASSARLAADALAVFGVVRYESEDHRQRMVRLMCVLVPVAWVIIGISWGKPVTLVFVGAVAQGLMLPFLAIAALWLLHRENDPALLPGRVWRTFLWASAACMIVTGAYQVASKVLGLF